MKQASSISPELDSVFSYFEVYDYAPTLHELYMFLPKSVDFETFRTELEHLCEIQAVVRVSRDAEYDFEFYPDISICRYTRGGYVQRSKVQSLKSKVSKISGTIRKSRETKRKLEKAKLFIWLFAWVPWVRLIGISGSVAMRNAEAGDDIDIFTICAENRMFLVRIIGLLILTIIGLRRKREVLHAPDKVCLNLFFSESDLGISPEKQSEYTAHEVLQMKPVVAKRGSYRHFLHANGWVLHYFPNATDFIKSVASVDTAGIEVQYVTPVRAICQKLFDWCEVYARIFQMYLIQKHTTNEYITSTQLWFFPHDVGADRV